MLLLLSFLIDFLNQLFSSTPFPSKMICYIGEKGEKKTWITITCLLDVNKCPRRDRIELVCNASPFVINLSKQERKL